MHVFVDESGDLGFGNLSTKNFIVAYAVIDSPERVRVDMKRLRKKLCLRHNYTIEEFKFSKDNEFIRSRVLANICGQDVTIGIFVADKKAVLSQLRQDPSRLYNYVVVNTVITNLVQAFEFKDICFVIDKSLPSKSIEHFNRYLREKISWRQVRELGKEMPKVTVYHEDSRNDQCLQLIDYCAGAAFNYFERNNRMHYGILESKVRFRTSWGMITW